MEWHSKQERVVISQELRFDESVPVSSELQPVSGAVITIIMPSVEDDRLGSTAEESTATVGTEMQDIQFNPPLLSSCTNTEEIHRTNRVMIPEDISNTPPVLSTPIDTSNGVDTANYVPELRRSNRNTATVLQQCYRFDSACLVLDLTLNVNHSSLPSSFCEAMKSTERDK